MTTCDFFDYCARAGLLAVLLCGAALYFGWAWVPLRLGLWVALVGSGVYVWFRMQVYARDRRYGRARSNALLSVIIPVAVILVASGMMLAQAGIR